MAIVKMARFRLFVDHTKRNEALAAMQKFDIVHFAKETEMNDDPVFKEVDRERMLREIDQETKEIEETIALIAEELGTGNKEELFPLISYRKLMEEGRKTEVKPIVDDVKNRVKNRARLTQERANIVLKKREYEPWKKLRLPLRELKRTDRIPMTLATIRGVNLAGFVAVWEERGFVYEELLMTKSMAHLALIYDPKRQEEAIALMREYGAVEIILDGDDTVAGEMEKLDERIASIDSEIVGEGEAIMRHKDDLATLKLRFEYLANARKIASAEAQSFRSNHVDIYEGYLPVNLTERFEKMLSMSIKEGYYLETEAVEDGDDRAPTMLKSAPLAKPFEDLTFLYAVPRYGEIDPTPLLAPFYWVFFGMMAGDVGYGLLLILGCLFLLKSKTIFPNNKKFVKFLFVLSFSVTLWGAVYGSFFGNLIPIPGLINAERDINTLLIMSVLFGIVHVFVGLGIKGYMLIRDGKWKDAVYDVAFWYMAVGGAILFLGGGAANFSSGVIAAGKWIMIAGMAGIVLTGGRDGKSVISKLIGGIYSLYNISGYIGDFVSYTRLMALGLAGGFIALAVNMITGMLWGSAIGKVFGVVVFVVFHLFNLFLSVLGAYVHTARLTYVEYFGKFYEGGGTAFEHFRSEPHYLRIKDEGGI